MYASQAAKSVRVVTPQGINEAVPRLNVYITAIIMMLITILLMIEDRCNTSFATNDCYVHISFILGDENGCKTNSAFYFNATIVSAVQDVSFTLVDGYQDVFSSFHHSE